jgi:light-regulated signal transduction histidine kinase (bacteriophytochrome)
MMTSVESDARLFTPTDPGYVSPPKGASLGRMKTSVPYIAVAGGVMVVVAVGIWGLVGGRWPVLVGLFCASLAGALLCWGVSRFAGSAARVREGAEAEIRLLNQQLEQRVQERTGQLQAINHELEAFCYSVSHDLRAPLRSIRGFSEVLLDRYRVQLDQRGQEYLERISQSSEQMDTLIEDLLKLSRVSRSELHLQTVNLSELVGSITANMVKTEPGRVVEFVITPELKAQGDERLLRVALDNLLQNAWKFSSRQPQTRIEFGVTPEPEAAFYVRDNGAGFDMAYADRLFGVFQRLHSLREFPGTGVGLATVQRIINRHGGRAWATGAVNQGATFFFTLPSHENS